MKKLRRIISLIIIFALILSSCGISIHVVNPIQTESTTSVSIDTGSDFDFSLIPEYSGKPYVVLNENTPDFTDRDLKTKSFEYYGKLDYLGRCTACTACIGKDLMPNEKRGSISAVKPTGWQSVRYSFVDGGSLYNRCHLIGYQLTGENANKNNLITGTRYLNVEGMLPFEDKAANYIKTTNNHVLYRVTPRFKDNELVARGVQMEAYSVEDNGHGICYNVYLYNVQPGVEINYLNGKSNETKEKAASESSANQSGVTYVLNTKSRKFHRPDCNSVNTMEPSNKKNFSGTRNELIKQGYSPCGSCKP